MNICVTSTPDSHLETRTLSMYVRATCANNFLMTFSRTMIFSMCNYLRLRYGGNNGILIIRGVKEYVM